LGVDVGISYEQSKIQIQPGDTIVAYTDGISEAMNSEGDLYGTQRIKEQLSHSCESITQTGREILDDVNRFVKDYRQSDDICLTCLRRAQT